MRLLTPLMLKILSRHASGRELKDVATDIYVSYSCVTNNVYKAKKRTNTHTLAELVMLAHSLGYLSHPTGPDLTVVALDPLGGGHLGA